jgi:hypothetical protein
MALILFGTSTCSICGVVMNEGDDYVATSHFIGDPSSPLWPHSDSMMHRACFLHWELRPVFVDMYNATAGQRLFGNGQRWRMQSDGTIVSEKAEPKPE